MRLAERLDQACAVSTGCFPGDDPGFPVTIIEPGSYRLTGNLDLSAFDSSLSGIVVSAPTVTVDLGGFHIAGATTCSGNGASISCSPSGTGSGVYFSNNATASVVQNGIVRNMTNSGIYCLATGSRLQNITATHNANDGIFAQQGTLVVNSVAIENGKDGIHITSGSMVDGVTSIGNGQSGVHAEGFSGGSVVTRAVARNNGDRGFLLMGLPKFGKNNLSIGNATADQCGGGICTERRRIYATVAKHQGDTVLAPTTCALGFHVATKTDLFDIGRYDYDYILGLNTEDSGTGMPTSFLAWVRSGDPSPSYHSCNLWTSAATEETGITVGIDLALPPGLTTALADDITVRTWTCSSPLRVWCIE